MFGFLAKNSFSLTVILLIALGFELVHLSIKLPKTSYIYSGSRIVNGFFSPIIGFYKSAEGGFGNFWDSYVALMSAKEEQSELISKIKGLELQNSELPELKKENERLREILEFKNSRESKGVVAKVIAYEPNNLLKTITIDKGSKQGLKPGMAVVDGAGLVGQTTLVWENGAKVLLITANNSAVDVLIQDTRIPGIVEGTRSNNPLKLAMRYVVKEEELKQGQIIITSGLDGIFQKGIIVGHIADLEQGVGGLFQNIIVEPKVDVTRLENVFVIKSESKKSDTIPEEILKEESSAVKLAEEPSKKLSQ